MKIIIIGAGPAGYTAAFKAREAGHEVILGVRQPPTAVRMVHKKIADCLDATRRHFLQAYSA